MNQIAFTFWKTREHCGDHEVRVLVDGQDLLEGIDEDMIGLNPPKFFEQPEIKGEGNLLIGRCSCGILGCGSASVFVSRTLAEVRWRVPDRSGANFHTLVFDAADYDRALECNALEASWNLPGTRLREQNDQ